MANRIITAAVTGETIRLSNKTAGAAGSFNSVSLSLTFDGAWDGTTKKLYFFDAYGNNAVYRLLTTELLVDGAYIVPIPAEPLAYAGEMTITIRGIDFATNGTTAERIIMSASTTMKVLSAIAPASDVAPVEPTPTQAEQLQTEIDDIKSTVTNAYASATAAANSATASATSATAAQTAQAASESARDLAVSAKTAAQTAETNAETAQSAAENARTGAQTAETNAGTYATSAGNSATAASGSATDANIAKVAAQTAQTAAETAKTNAETAETNAETAETNAKASETNAASSASAASTSASNASSSASAASSSATNASSSASAAASSASASSSSASAADSAKTAAASSASEAATSASNAASSATAAANSAASLVVVNDLTTGGTTNALSAEQGKVLSASISELSADLSNSSVVGAEIYGAYWDKSATPTLTRLNLAKNAIVNLGTDAIYAVNEFDTSSLFASFINVTDSYGNVFVRIPRIYIKKVDTTGHKAWYASRRPFAGAYLPKCFWDFTNSKELDYIDVGAYNASSADGTKLDSKPGTYPLINKTIVQFRTMAQANGTGYQQLDIHVVDLLQTLFIIEQGTIQSQSKVAGYTGGQYTATHLATATETAASRIIVATATAALYEVGQAISVGTSQGGNQIFYGRTITGKTVIDASNTAIEFDGTAVNIATGNMLYNTGAKSGFSAGIAASVGSPVSNSSGKFPFVWHGIENLFGSIYQFVDGVNINDRQAWVCPDAASYASNLFTAPYEQLNYVNGTADGYIKEMGYDPAHPYASFPTTVGGSSSTYYGDYYYQSTGQRVARLGGGWSVGADAGLFCWPLRSLSSLSDPAVGGRLIKKPL